MKKRIEKRKLNLERKTILHLQGNAQMGGDTQNCITQVTCPDTWDCTRSTIPGYCNNTTQPPPPSTTKPICD